MNFSGGQIAFILFFIVAFAVGMIYAYRKDIKVHKRAYTRPGRTVLTIMGTGIAVYCIIRFLLYTY